MSLQVQVGDVIRGYDFKPSQGRPDCYVEGTVLDVNNQEQGYQAYKVRVTADKFDEAIDREPSADCRVGHIVYIPWRVSFMEYPGRVINLSR